MVNIIVVANNNTNSYAIFLVEMFTKKRRQSIPNEFQSLITLEMEQQNTLI